MNNNYKALNNQLRNKCNYTYEIQFKETANLISYSKINSHLEFLTCILLVALLNQFPVIK